MTGRALFDEYGFDATCHILKMQEDDWRARLVGAEDRQRRRLSDVMGVVTRRLAYDIYCWGKAGLYMMVDPARDWQQACSLGLQHHFSNLVDLTSLEHAATAVAQCTHTLHHDPGVVLRDIATIVRNEDQEGYTDAEREQWDLYAAAIESSIDTVAKLPMEDNLLWDFAGQMRRAMAVQPTS